MKASRQRENILVHRSARPESYASAHAELSVPARLKELNITLPPVLPPVANYVDSVRAGNLLFLAGNTGGPDGKFKGKVGKDLSVQEGYDNRSPAGPGCLAAVECHYE